MGNVVSLKPMSVKPVINLTNTIDELLDANLTSRELKVALFIARATFGFSDGREWFTGTQKTICDATDIHKANVSRTINDLCERNVIQYSSENGYRINTNYREWRELPNKVAKTATKKGSCQNSTQLPKQQQKVVKTATAYIEESKSSLDIPTEPNGSYGISCPTAEKSDEIPPDKIPIKPDKRKPKPREPVTDGFAEFYELWPKKEKREDALKAWKAGKCYKHKDAILADVQARSHEQTGCVKWFLDYIQLPASYLRGKCWHDEWESMGKYQLEERLEIYNRCCPQMVPCNTLRTDSRFKAMQWLVDKDHLATLAQWEHYCTYMHTIPRFRGEKPNRSGHMQKADIDLILRQDIFTKAWERANHGGI